MRGMSRGVEEQGKGGFTELRMFGMSDEILRVFNTHTHTRV